MNREDMEKRAAALRTEAARLEALAFNTRPLPEKWQVGQRVRFLKDREWAWSKGSEATIVRLRGEYAHCLANHYQVFYTSPDSKDVLWWTTSADVELVSDEK